MKYRIDFVTNSSSSSYTISISILTEQKECTFDMSKFANIEMGDQQALFFYMQELSGLKSVSDLCNLLYKKIYINEMDIKDEDAMVYWFGEEDFEQIKNDFQTFFDRVQEEVPKIDDIKNLVIKGEFWGGGESYSFTVENDQKLKEYAQKLIDADGDEKKSIKKAMKQYMNTPHPVKTSESFPKYAVRYHIPRDLESFAKDLISGEYAEYSMDWDRGYDIREIDIKNKTENCYSYYEV